MCCFRHRVRHQQHHSRCLSYSSPLWSQQPRGGGLYFHLLSQSITFSILGAVLREEKQEVGRKYSPCNPLSGGGLTAVDRTAVRSAELQTEGTQRVLQAELPSRLPSRWHPVGCNLMTWSSATRNRGSSLCQAVLPAFSALPKCFSSRLSKMPRWQTANGPG